MKKIILSICLLFICNITAADSFEEISNDFFSLKINFGVENTKVLENNQDSKERLEKMREIVDELHKKFNGLYYNCNQINKELERLKNSCQ